MDLDNIDFIKKIDTGDMLAHINGLPNQLRTAWELGLSHQLPKINGLKNIIIAGMGGSAIGGDLVTTFVTPLCPLPIFIDRDYDLPAWVQGPETLVITSSHSGNTEETLSVFEQALQKDCHIVSISTGGKLTEAAKQNGFPAWTFQHDGMPRAAVGFSFGLILALLFRLGLIPDPSTDLLEAVAEMEKQKAQLLPEIPVVHNPAKRLAGQLIGRYVTVIGSGYMTPVARRWKGQINELAKAWAQFEVLPEADHNTLAGLLNPTELLSHSDTIFLRAASDHSRNQLRSELTLKEFMTEGLATDVVKAQGNSILAQMWTTLHLGDYVAYYLAMAYQVDPTPINALLNLKIAMKK